MRVQTVEWSNAYGDHTRSECERHSRITEQAQTDNARYSYFPVAFKAHGDWHEGECESADYVTPAEISYGHKTPLCV